MTDGAGTALQAGPARLPGASPVAVIDIGSNSVRLVVYERLSRALTVLYNEKSVSSLGSGLGETGRLAPESIERALTAIARFKAVCSLMGVTDVHPFATSASREADNGPEFIAQVRELLGVPVRVFSGEEEAEYSALGVLSGNPQFRGVTGDLGGGSLELGSIGAGGAQQTESRTLGVLSLQEDSGGSPKRALKLVRKRLADSEVLTGYKKGSFCAVGGSWRALATFHQVRSKYPLHMVHGYRVPAADLLELCEELTADGPGKLSGLSAIDEPRRSQLPYAAAVMAGVLRRGKFAEVVFSAQGIREGVLFSLLEPREQALDPLLQATAELSLLRSRAPAFAADLIEGSRNFLALLDLSETEYQARLRAAACNLSDIGWRAHPEYQGDQSVDMVAYSGLVGIDHPGRAFLAEAVAIRYMGLKRKTAYARVLALAGKKLNSRARLLGGYFRLVYPLAAASPGILPRIAFSVSAGTLELRLPRDLAPLLGERVSSRHDQLAAEAGFKKSRVLID